MATKRTRTTRKPPEERAVTYLYENDKLQLVMSDKGCDGCYFDQGGRCLLGDEPQLNRELDCTIKGGDYIFKLLQR